MDYSMETEKETILQLKKSIHLQMYAIEITETTIINI